MIPSLIILFTFLLRRYLLAVSLSPLMYLYSKKAKKKFAVSLSTKNIGHNKTVEKKRYRAYLSRGLAGLYRSYVRVLGQTASMRFRLMVYKHVLLLKAGKKVVIYHNADIRAPYNIFIGEGSIIGDNAILDGRNGITIGANVNFSSNVSVWTEQHDHRDPFFRCETQSKSRTVIEDRVWVGPNTIILPSVKIREGSVVAAGAVVVKDIEPYAICAGIPAKKIAERNTNLEYVFSGEYLPFN